MTKFSNTYENFLVIGDFNMTPENENMIFCKPATPSCIDLNLTNKKSFFMRLGTFPNGLSDFHKVATTILRKTTPKGNPKTILYRDSNLFHQNKFMMNLKMKTFQGILISVLNN